MQLCQVVFNEVEGMLAENLTEAKIASILEQDICPRLPSVAKTMCMLLADKFLPFVIARLEAHVLPGDACTEFQLCSAVPQPHTDPEPVQILNIDLDLPPIQRFVDVCGDPAYTSDIQEAVNWLKSWIPLDVWDRIEQMGADIGNYLPYPFADEITGCSQSCGMPLGDLMLLNIAYELTDACMISHLASIPLRPSHHQARVL
jgi:hypothetical protein